MDKRERDTMKKKNLQRKQRLLAVVLSVMLFAGLLPGSLSQVLAASDEYEDCCIAEVAGDEPDGIYEIEMLKADQSMAFSEETVNLEYGATTYVQVANAVESQDAADGKGYGTGAVTYQLTDNTLGAQIDEKSGTLTFSDGKTGSVTVTAKKEAESAFGDGTMYIEHFVEHPRHIEFQILADSQGHVIHLGERDCSIQRNHQKMIEESPSAAISPRLRKVMGKAAVGAAKAAGYVNAGTIEFLLEGNGQFYFMEMNTRIQVEHPVTEFVTGLDLVKEQLRIASGLPLSVTQKEVQLSGHAIECRINAENPKKGFRPSPGKISEVHFPGGNGVRVDTGIYSGYQVPPYYDSIVAKLIVHGKDRAEAIAKMRSALGETILDGIDTNIDYQYEILSDPDYQAGNFDIEFLNTHRIGGISNGL